MKTLHLVIITISCFCAVDLIFIQSNFFIQCGWQSIEYDVIHPVYCNDAVQNLRLIFGIPSSLGIATLVGISAILSPKKSIILLGAIAGLYVYFIVTGEILYISRSVVPPGIMRPMTTAEMMTLTVLEVRYGTISY